MMGMMMMILMMILDDEDDEDDEDEDEEGEDEDENEDEDDDPLPAGNLPSGVARGSNLGLPWGGVPLTVGVDFAAPLLVHGSRVEWVKVSR